MARLRSFTLDGEAIRVSASLNNAGDPVYRVELMHERENEKLDSEGLLQFAQSLQRDVYLWDGILHTLSDRAFTNDVIAGFEADWGGASDGVPLHPAPEE